MAADLFNLSGKTALVTGGSKGLGKAMARGLAEQGADVVISSRHENELRAALDDILKGLDRKGSFIVADMARREEVARDISRQMGKPVAEARGEVGTCVARALHLASIAEETLADERLPEKADFERFIAREPLGVVVDVAPWNYPLLTAINVVAPAVLAGNAQTAQFIKSIGDLLVAMVRKVQGAGI